MSRGVMWVLWKKSVKSYQHTFCNQSNALKSTSTLVSILLLVFVCILLVYLLHSSLLFPLIFILWFLLDMVLQDAVKRCSPKPSLTSAVCHILSLVIWHLQCETEANFISIKGPELLNKYVGESERAVRQVFQRLIYRLCKIYLSISKWNNRAAASSPCIVFFDELDALAPRRSNDESSESSKRVVNQLLTEMDGMDHRNEVFVIAATNRPGNHFDVAFSFTYLLTGYL